jgi:transposase
VTRADSIATGDLPTDPEAMRASLLAMMAERDAAMAARDIAVAERDAAIAERDALAARNERLQALWLKLRRMQFGPRSERLPEEQLALGLEDLETAISQTTAETERADPALRDEQARKRRASRCTLPAHLPRIEVVLMPPDTTCPCCEATMVEIGEDRSERLDTIPAQYRVLVTRRPKFACRTCTGVVVQAPAAPRLIEGGLPTEATVSNVVVSRFADHQPLYRQAQIMRRQGVEIDRSTLAFWVGYAAAEIAPVVRRLKEIVLGSTRLFADETVVPVLDPGRGRTKQGYFWTIARDDRPWGGPDPPAVVYTYAPGRQHEHARTLLGSYRGILQCDGYAAYKVLVDPTGRRGPCALAFCWSHVRRGFYDLVKGGLAPIATEALRRIAALYRIEAEIRGQNAGERRAARQARSRPLLDELRIWFRAQLAKLPGSAPTAKAIAYALNHWDGLMQFVDDGHIEIDSNSVERSMRPVALSRKNSLFAGSDNGAENWAAVASLIETCKLNKVDPQRYLTELLTRLVNGWPQARIDGLMPWCLADTKAA